MKHLSRVTIAVPIAVACLTSSLSATAVVPACKALKAGDRARLLAFVEKKYKLPPAAPVVFGDESFVGSTCFRRIEFKSANPKESFHRELFLSPDLRFLTTELLDSTVDPVLEERRKQEALAAALTNGNFPSQGPKDARVTLTIFSDFQCPYCSQLAKMLKNDILPKEGATTRVVFRFFPITIHNWAEPAAQATACAQEQGDDYFWRLHDFLFEHQREITHENVLDRLKGETKGFRRFDSARYAGCVAGKKTAAKIDRDVKFGMENGVNGTPTMFINSQRVGNVVAPEQLRTLIRQAGSSTPRTELSSR